MGNRSFCLNETHHSKIESLWQPWRETNLIRFRYLFKHGFSVFLIREIFVGVPFHGESLVRSLQVLILSIPIDLKDVVVINTHIWCFRFSLSLRQLGVLNTLFFSVFWVQNVVKSSTIDNGLTVSVYSVLQITALYCNFGSCRCYFP